MTNLVLPLLGIGINVYIFYKNFLQTFLIERDDFKTQIDSVSCFAVVVLAASVFTVIGIRRTGGCDSRTTSRRSRRRGGRRVSGASTAATSS